MITSIYIGVDKLDLFKDDNIELKSSISEIQDITKIFTDSTNSFSVPATDNNNRIFKHFYNSNLVDGWDVFNKSDAVIELNGILYRQGKIKLNNVITKSQKPISYNIQFYGLLTSLKDILSDDKLNSLDFSSYNFTQNATNVINQLKTQGTQPNDIVNTTLSTKRLIYNSDETVNNTDTILNIANNNTDVLSGLIWNETQTSILNTRIIEAIESKYSISFSRDFFGTNVFSHSYLLLNGKDIKNNIEQQVVFDDFTSDPTLYDDKILLSTELTELPTTKLRISIQTDGLNGLNTDFTSVIKADGVEIHREECRTNNSGLYVYLVKKSDFITFKNLTFHIFSDVVLNYRYTVDRYQTETYPVPLIYKSERGFNDIIGTFDVASKMPDLKIIDYIKGLFNCFKLIAINTSDTDVFVQSLENYYRNGSVKEITNYVDFKEIPISTGKVFNEINYKFKEPQTLLSKQFFSNNGVNYGDLEYKIVDINGKLVDGESIDISLPFENMIYERIFDSNGLDNIAFQYGLLTNDSLEPVNVKAHIHYVENISTLNTIKVLNSSTTYTTINSVNIPLHTLGVNTPQYSLVFGEEFNEYNGNLITNTIYSNFHKNFIENAFNKNKRLTIFNCKNLPIEFLLKIKLNDVLEIKEQYYRINKYKLNLLTKECVFEVYNIKDLDLTPLYPLTVDSNTITVDSTLINVSETISPEQEIIPV